MKVNQMKAFSEVMITGSVSEAARNLHRTQPSVSALIASLENELGIDLFDRQKGRLVPVPEAYYLQEECARILGQIDAITEKMSSIRALDQGELRIVANPGTSFYLLPDLISRMVAEHPGLRCTLISRSSDVVFQTVAAQQYELGIADHVAEKPLGTTLMSEEVFGFELLCAMPADDPLAKKSVITPRDLDGRPLATLFDEHRTVEQGRRYFADMGCAFKQRFVAQFFVPLLTYVARGQAIALVDPVAVRSYHLSGTKKEPLVFRRFEPAIEHHLVLVTPSHRPQSLLTKTFVEMVRQLFLAMGQGEELEQLS